MPSPSVYPIVSRARPLLAAVLPFTVLCVGCVLISTTPAHAEKWALLIGIDKYQDSNRINSLGSAAADARALKKALIESEGVSEANVKLLVSNAAPDTDSEAKPERNTILRELSTLAKNVRPGDTVFVFFSGHGIEKNGSSYLLPYDTDAYDSNTITDTAIDTTKFRERLQDVHAGLLVLAFDMCRDNPVKGARDAVSSGNTLNQAQVRGLDFAGLAANGGSAPVTSTAGPSAVVTLFSCSPGERSYEWIAKGRGYFSWFLEQALRGAKEATGADGAVYVDTLTKYVSRSVSSEVQRDEGKNQTPFIEIKGQIDASRLALTTSGSGAPATSRDDAPVLATDPRAYIKVSLSPENATLLIDGAPQHPIAGRVALDLAGSVTRTVEVGVQAAGFEAVVERVTLTHGTVSPLSIRLLPSPAAALPPPPTTGQLPHAASGGSPSLPAAAGAAPSCTLLMTLTGHAGNVHSVSYSPDGRYILTAGGDMTARVWDSATGKTLKVFAGHKQIIWGATFSPDGRSIATASFDKTAKVWDAATGSEMFTLRGHADGLNSVEFSPDGRFLVTSSSDRVAKIWDAASGHELSTLNNRASYITAASYSPDGRYILTGNWNGNALLWDAKTGQPIRRFEGHAGSIITATFSSDGRYVLTASKDTTARIWDTETGGLLRILVANAGPVWAAAFSPDGRFVVTGCDWNTAKVWDAATGQEIGQLPGHGRPVRAVCFSPDSKYILTGCDDRLARVWSAPNGAAPVK